MTPFLGYGELPFWTSGNYLIWGTKNFGTFHFSFFGKVPVLHDDTLAKCFRKKPKIAREVQNVRTSKKTRSKWISVYQILDARALRVVQEPGFLAGFLENPKVNGGFIITTGIIFNSIYKFSNMFWSWRKNSIINDIIDFLFLDKITLAIERFTTIWWKIEILVKNRNFGQIWKF